MAELNKNISLQNALNSIKELTINFISEKYCTTINEIINYLNFYNLNKKNNLSDNLTENIIFFIEEINTNIFLFDNIFLEDKNSINSTIKLFYNYILNNQIFSFEKNIGYLNKLYNLLFKYKNFSNIDNEKLMNIIEQLKQNKNNEKIEFLNNLKTKIELINNNNNNTVLNSNNKQKNDSNFLNKKRISSNNKIEKYFISSKLKNFKGVKSIIEKEDINKKTIIKTNNNTNLNSDSSFTSLSTKCTYNQENIINNEKKSKEKNLKDFSDSNNNNNNKIFNNKFFSFNNSNLNSSNSNLSNFLLYNNNNTNSNFSFSSDNTFSGINSKLSTFSFKNLIKSTKKKKKYFNSFNEKIKKKIYDKIKTNENNINNSNKSKENKDIKLKELKNIINSHFYDKKNYIDDLCNLDTAKKEKNINNNNNSLNDMNFIKINKENNYDEQYNNNNENKYNNENDDEEDDDDNIDIDINKIENKTENNKIEKDILAYKTPNKSKIKNFFMNKENNLEEDKNLLNLLNQK